MKLAGVAAVAGTAWAATPANAQMSGQFKAVKALAFDAYGTLFDVFSVTALCEQLYPGKGNQLAQIWRVKQLQYSLMRSLMGRHRDFWGLTEDGLVWAIKKQGVKLAILSNGEPKMLEAAAKSAGIRDFLDEIISVEEVKVFKVSPRVYNLGPERMKVTNPELGFISANSWDINGAASAGLNTFWIQRSTAEVPEELGFQASAVVKAITDLAPLLRG
jgi:2-haloacid dehalogenase